MAQLEGAIMAVKKTERTVKTVKSVFAIFHLETTAVQPVPTKIARGDFTAFALILRLGMGGRGVRKGRIMKAELRNRDRFPNGVVKSAQHSSPVWSFAPRRSQSQ
jgi:hypothetical protein